MVVLVIHVYFFGCVALRWVALGCVGLRWVALGLRWVGFALETRILLSSHLRACAFRSFEQGLPLPKKVAHTLFKSLDPPNLYCARAKKYFLRFNLIGTFLDDRCA